MLWQCSNPTNIGLLNADNAVVSGDIAGQNRISSTASRLIKCTDVHCVNLHVQAHLRLQRHQMFTCAGRMLDAVD